MLRKQWWKVLFILLAAALFLAGCAGTKAKPELAAGDSAVHLIAPPKVNLDPEGGYSFVVFGDTRTGNADDVSPESKAFHRIRDRVHRSVNGAIEGGAGFALYAGDMIYQGSGLSYWEEIRDLVPPELRSASDPKIFPILGNHETWQVAGQGDAMANFFGTFPYLAEGGKQLHNYAFAVGSSLFVGLCSGGYGDDPDKFAENNKRWNCRVIGSFEELMASLVRLYEDQKRKGLVRNIFVQYHKPSFSTYKHPPLIRTNDPLGTLQALKTEDPALGVYVFNGHNHTTELFAPEGGGLVLVAGGGGAPQKDLPAVDHGKPAPEIFWKAVGEERYRRADYFQVFVGGEDAGVRIEERALWQSEKGAQPNFVKGVVVDEEGKARFQGRAGGSYRLDDIIPSL